MKRSLLVLIALVLIAPVFFAQGPPPPPPPPVKPKPVSEWQSFTSTDGNFSLLLPKTPREAKQELQTEIGNVPMKMFSTENGIMAYLAMYADYPVIFDTPSAIKSSLDGSRDLMLSRRNGQVISERDINYGKFPGREFKAKTDQGVLTARIILVHQRSYVLMAIVPLANDDNFPQAKDAEKYFDSFKLLKEPERPTNLGSMSEVASSADQINVPPGFFDKPTAWREFSPSEFGFKVQLPGEPFHHSTPLNPNDRRLDIHLWMSKGDDFIAEVLVQPMLRVPPDEPQRNLIFKSVVNGLLEDGDVKLLGEKPITFQDYPAREYKLQFEFGVATGKAFLVGSTVYMLLGIPIQTESSEGMTRFFDSFAVTSKPPASGKMDESVAPPPPKPMPAPKDGTPPPKKINVSGGVLQANAIRKVQPAYPKDAKQNGVQGEVKVQINISEEGVVIDAVAISGPEELRAVSVEAARQWSFMPTELSGMPVRVQGVLTFNFTLR